MNQPPNPMKVRVHFQKKFLHQTDPELYKSLQFGDFEGSLEDLKNAMNMVSVLEVDNLEEAFKYTQNGVPPTGNGRWEDGSHVEKLMIEENRSSMVGDLFEVVKEGENEFYLMEMIGFQEL